MSDDNFPRLADGNRLMMRDYFAAFAMQSLMRIGASQIEPNPDGDEFPEQPWYFGFWEPDEKNCTGVTALARDAYKVADAMMAARNKPTNEIEAEGRGTDAAGKEPAAKE